MKKEKKEKEKEKADVKICNYTITIHYLEKMIKRHQGTEIDKFLGKEINRLTKEKENLLQNGKSN